MMNEINWFRLAVLSVVIGLFLGAKALGQTPTPEPTITPIPTATPTPTQTPNSIDEYRGKKVVLKAEEPVRVLSVSFWRLEATLETNIEAPKAFPFVRILGEGEPAQHYYRWYSLRAFPEDATVISATLEFAPLADTANNVRVFIFPFEDRGVAGATLKPME